MRRTRHRFLCLALFGLVGCADELVRPVWEPEVQSGGEMFTISGIVIDSVSGEVLPGVRVASGPYVTEADAAGQWSLAVPAGEVSVSTSPAGYERTSFRFTLIGNAFLTLAARRLAPFVQECVRDGSSVHALVSDLQGRKTIERWQKSEAFVVDPAGEYRIGAPAWSYESVDYLTWKVTLGPVAPETMTIRWNIFDAEGHRFSGSCEPSPPPIIG